MQSQQPIHRTKEYISNDRTSSASSTSTDPSNSSDHQEIEKEHKPKEEKLKNHQDKQYRVTQQPTSLTDLDYPAHKSTVKKKKRRPRCCRKSLQSDKEYCDACDIWLCRCNCDGDACASCGSCGSCGD